MINKAHVLLRQKKEKNYTKESCSHYQDYSHMLNILYILVLRNSHPTLEILQTLKIKSTIINDN